MIEVLTFEPTLPANACQLCDEYQGLRYYGETSDRKPVFGDPKCEVFFHFKRHGFCSSARVSGTHGVMSVNGFSVVDRTANFAAFCSGCDNFDQGLKICKFHPGYDYLIGTGPADYIDEGRCFWAKVKGVEGVMEKEGFCAGEFLVM